MNAISKGKDSVILEFPPRDRKRFQRKEKCVLGLWRAYGQADDRRARQLIALALTRLAGLPR
jgi:hypothetical protein